MRFRALIADRRPLILQGLSSVLEAQPDFVVVARCDSGAGCVEAIRLFRPHIVVLGASMPDKGALEIIAIASSQAVPAQLVLLVESESCNVQAPAGARAIISDDIDLDALVQSLRQVAGSNKPLPLSPDRAVFGKQRETLERSMTALTDRERQIMRLVSEGLSNKEIGRRLNLSDGTIKVHLHHIFQKLEVGNRTALAALVNGILWSGNRPLRNGLGRPTDATCW
jgi:two-component system, NarL family, nitrate/nitrite response regulator NarL